MTDPNDPDPRSQIATDDDESIDVDIMLREPDGLSVETLAKQHHDVRRLNEMRAKAKAPNTIKAYYGQFKRYELWCKDREVEAIPPNVARVAAYLVSMADAGLKFSTISLAKTAIAVASRKAGFPWDSKDIVLTETMDAIRREIGVRPNKKRPVEEEALRAIAATCAGTSLLDRRDLAMFLVGWVGAFRRSEIVSLNMEDVTFRQEGMMILLRSSKTDQERAGHEKPLPFSSSEEVCPVRSLKAWLLAAGIQEGPLFRQLGRGNRLGGRLSGQSVALMIKSRCKQANLDPKVFSGHSLRAGFITTAFQNDKTMQQVQLQTGHKSADSAYGYYRPANLFKKNAAQGLL
jgi:integrase